MLTEINRAVRKRIKGTPEWLAANTLVSGGRVAPARKRRDLLTPQRHGITRTQRMDEPPVTPDMPHYTENVFMVWKGEVRRRGLNAKLPVPGVRLLAGQSCPSDEEDVARHMRMTLERCAPWVLGVVAPRMVSDYSTIYIAGEPHNIPDDSRFSGLASTDNATWSVIMVRSDQGCESARGTTHHEIWHMIQYSLSESANAALERCLSPYAYDHGGADYMKSSFERLARAYSRYACMAEDLTEMGQPLPIALKGPHKLLFDTFASVFSGDYAREVALNNELAETE